MKKRVNKKNSIKDSMTTNVLLTVAIVIVLFLILALIGPPTLKGKATYTRECADKVDNDGDGYIDLKDKGCKDKNDDLEANCGDNVCSGNEGIISCPKDCELDSCSDSDKGYQTGIKGTVTGTNNRKNFAFVDYCKNDKTLVEYNCKNNLYQSVFINCISSSSTRCQSGICV